MSSMIEKFLTSIERAGNRLPHPTVLFIYLCGFIVVLSAMFAWQGLSSLHPVSGQAYTAKSLLSVDGLHWMLTNTVKNFVSFAPVGTVLVAIMGIGIAERSGLIAASLTSLVKVASKRALSFVVVFAGVMSSIAADAGYVVLIPLAAMLFKASGRSPLVGIAAAFAGVSGGFSANLLIGPLDAILAGITTEAVQLVDTELEVNAAANYYFILVSTLLISVVATWVTEKIVAPRLERDLQVDSEDKEPDEVLAKEQTRSHSKAMRSVGWFTIAFIGLLLWLTVPENALLRSESGSLLRSPFISGIVVIVAIYAAIAGIIYGKVSGEFSEKGSVITALEKSMATMASYLVLMFFAAQFVNYFAWTDLGVIFAIKGAATLSAFDLSVPLTLSLFVIFAAAINLLLGSASAKWALLAPVFVPMFYLLGIQPEAVQVAYRIGDSTTNIITPLMPYFGVVVAFAQQYKKDLGMGDMIAMMLPYSLAMLMSWILMFAVWVTFELPLGPVA